MKFEVQDIVDVPAILCTLIREHAETIGKPDLAPAMIDHIAKEVGDSDLTALLYCRITRQDDRLVMLVEPHDRLTGRITRALRALQG